MKGWYTQIAKLHLFDVPTVFKCGGQSNSTRIKLYVFHVRGSSYEHAGKSRF